MTDVETIVIEGDLLRLPAEIVILIFEHLTTELYTLALVSRRLHYLALPIYLSRCRIPDPTTHAKLFLRNKAQIDALSALKVSLFVPSIKCLSCRFQNPGYYMDHLFSNLRRFTGLILKLSSIDEIILDFESNDRHNLSGDDPVLKKWCLYFGRILNAIIEKRCTSLTLRGGKFYTSTYHLFPKRSRLTSSRPFTVLRRVFGARSDASASMLQDDTWKFYRMWGKESVILELSENARLCSVLTTLSICSSMFLLPPCLSWTISTLQCSPIVHLTLSNISVDPSVWSITLPWIAKAVPALRELTISGCSMSFIDLLKLLDQLNSHVVLHIGSDVPLPRRSELSDPKILGLISIPLLPRLTHLHAPPEYIVNFLSLENALPSLKHLCICSFCSPYQKIHFMRAANTLSPVSYRLKDPAVTVSLDILAESPTPWTHGGLQAGSDISLSTTPLSHVTNITITNHTAFRIYIPFRTLSLLLAQFPAVQHVSFVGGPLRRWDSTYTTALIRTINKACPSVRTVVVEEESHDVAATVVDNQKN